MGSAETNAVPLSVSGKSWFSLAKEVFGDKKFIIGVILGVSMLGGGYAISAAGDPPTYQDPQSTMLTEQQSVITAQMRADAQACASGTQQGTVGNAINMSLKAHLELASASPNVEKLFDVNADCFAGLSALLDLSFAIPSLATIIAAAQNAVIAYAKKKICSAVSKVTGMVTGPINEAIGKANGYIGALNGLSANLNSTGGLSLLDPELGASYNQGQTGTYTTGTPFGNQPQATVPDSTGGTGTTPGTGTGTTPGTGTGTIPGTGGGTTPQPGGTNGPGSYFAVYSDLMRQRSQADNQLTTARQTLATAQQALSACSGACTAEREAVTNATRGVSNLETVLAGIDCKLNNMQADGSIRPGACTGTGSSSSSSGYEVQSKQSLTQKLTNLFQ